MNKKLSVLSILLSSFLLSCNSNVEPSNSISDNPSTPISESPSISEIAPTSETITSEVINDNLLYLDSSYQMIYASLSEDGLVYLEDYIYRFIDEYNLEIYGAPTDEEITEKEILIDLTNRQESIELAKNMTPTSYVVKVVNNKVVINANNEEQLIKALEHFYTALTKDDNGVGIDKDYCYYGDKYMDTYVPVLDINEMDAKSYSLYFSSDETHVMSYKSSSKTDFEKYKKLLLANNYNFEFDNQIEENYFATFTNDKALVNLAYYNIDNKLTLIYSPKGYIANQIEISNKIIDPSLTQIGRSGASQSSSGLSLTFQLEDGSYIMVDGGPTDSSDEVKLLNFLKDNNPNEGKPKITWIFTHAHHDHMNLALSFLEKYHNEIEVTMFCYNFPSIDDIPITEEPASRVETSRGLIEKLDYLIDTYYQDAIIYKHHAGDILHLAGCKIEFLQTHESYYPNEFSWFNHTSSAFIVTIDNKKVMVLGDSEYTNNEYLSYLYGDILKCDVLQLAHHGLNGGSLNLYKEIDPSICLWAIDETRYKTNDYCLGNKPLCDCNAWIRNNSIRVRSHYHASTTTTLYFKDM